MHEILGGRFWTRVADATRLGLAVTLTAAAVAAQVATPPESTSRLTAAVRDVLDRPAAQRSFWGVYCVDLESGEVLVDYNAHKLFVPASNAKLLSSALALTRLGPDYRFTTRVLTTRAPDDEGVVNGDLILVGGGDPNLSSRVLPYDPDAEFHLDRLAPITQIASAIVDAGISEISGNVIGDDSRYVFERHNGGWTLNDIRWGYGAPVSALSFNDNRIQVRIRPGAVGSPARLSFTPDLDFYTLRNETRTLSARVVQRRLGVDIIPQGPELILTGQIPSRSRGRSMDVPVSDPARLAAMALLVELQREGVEIGGEAEARHLEPYKLFSLKDGNGDHNVAGHAVAEVSSVPLRESLKVLNKESQNLHAEMMLYEVGYVRRGVGSIDAGTEELEAFLKEIGLKPWEFRLSDGSGLSRRNLISPMGTVKLLEAMWNSPMRDAYEASLPVAGEEGTLDWRFSKTAARGRIRAKTGTLTGVTALSGYADALDGRKLAFSIYANNAGTSGGYTRSIVDKITLEIVRGELADEVLTDASGE